VVAIACSSLLRVYRHTENLSGYFAIVWIDKSDEQTGRVDESASPSLGCPSSRTRKVTRTLTFYLP
jgi:hypothetical protein